MQNFHFYSAPYLKMELFQKVLTTIFCCAPALTLPANGNADFADSEAELKRVYTPARTQLRVREHLITPLYAYYAQGLPAALSTGGKMAYSTYGTGFAWRYVHPEKTRIALTSFDYRRTDFRFSGGSERPFSHTDSLRATTYQEFINPDNGLAAVAILSGSLAADDAAALSDGAGGMLALACKQYFSETTSVMLGAATLYRPYRERWYLLPVFSFDWRIAPNWNLRSFNGLTLTWDINGDNEFLVDFSVAYESSSFAVAAERAITSPDFGKDGDYRRQSVPVSVAGTWNLSENIFLSTGIVLNTWSEFRLYRDGHKTREKFSTDPTLEFFLQAGFRF